MKNSYFNECNSCDCHISKYIRKKKINYGKIIGYAIILGIGLYAAWGQFFQEKDSDVKTEQVGKNIGDLLE